MSADPVISILLLNLPSLLHLIQVSRQRRWFLIGQGTSLLMASGFLPLTILVCYAYLLYDRNTAGSIGLYSAYLLLVSSRAFVPRMGKYARHILMPITVALSAAMWTALVLYYFVIGPLPSTLHLQEVETAVAENAATIQSAKDSLNEYNATLSHLQKTCSAILEDNEQRKCASNVENIAIAIVSTVFSFYGVRWLSKAKLRRAISTIRTAANKCGHDTHVIW